MPKLTSMLPLDCNAAEAAEFALIVLALLTGAGAIGCNLTAGDKVLMGHDARGWELAGAWCTGIAVLCGTSCLLLALHLGARGTKGGRHRRHLSAQRYVWPEVGELAAVSGVGEATARMDETQQAELARQLALVEAQGSLVGTQAAAAVRHQPVAAAQVGAGQ